jgi:hypothetical protein
MGTRPSDFNRITFGYWFRNYHQDGNIEPLGPEEIAWGIIARNNWIASPELLLSLTQFVKDRPRQE